MATLADAVEPSGLPLPMALNATDAGGGGDGDGDDDKRPPGSSDIGRAHQAEEPEVPTESEEESGMHGARVHDRRLRLTYD